MSGGRMMEWNWHEDDAFLRAVADTPNATRYDVANALGVPAYHAASRLDTLAKKGLVLIRRSNTQNGRPCIYSLMGARPEMPLHERLHLVEAAAERPSGLWDTRQPISWRFIEQLQEIADAAWHYDNMEMEQADVMFDAVTDWMRQALVGYQPRRTLPGFVRQSKDAA